MKTPALNYLVYREGMSSVFVPQTGTLLGHVERHGLSVRLGVLTPIGEMVRPSSRRKWQRVMKSLRNVYSGPLTRLPSPPSRARGLWSDAFVLSLWLRRHDMHAPSTVLQCRNAEATRIALGARRSLRVPRIIYDCRGLESDEYVYSQGYTDVASAPPDIQARAHELLESQRIAAQHSQAILCVSRAMKQHIVSSFGIPPDKITVVPCCVDADSYQRTMPRRQQMRERLSLSDRFVVAYCGSLRRWQLPKRSLELFLILKKLQPAAHFLALVTEPERMRAIARSNGLQESDMTVLRVPHEQVPSYLACADIGILMRESSLVNQVASPVKFGEYLASGTPVIISPGVGDFSAATEKEGIGIVVDAGTLGPETEAKLSAWITTLLRNAPSRRERCQAFVRRHLSWSQHLPSIEELYTRLCETDK